MDAYADLVALGEARLPGAVPREVFVARIERALAEAQLEDIHAADLYFACALGRGHAQAIALAETELMPLVRQSVGKVDSNRAFVDEVSQRVREKLLVGEDRAIDQYKGTGPLGRWVRVIATRIALDLKRADAKIADDDDDAIAQLPAPDDPELLMMWQTCA